MKEIEASGLIMNRKIKVLHVVQGTEGGTLEYLKLFFMYMNKKKYNMELVCPNYGPFRSEISKIGIKVYTIDIKRNINLIDDYKAYRQLKHIIKLSRPDIIHLHSSKAGVVGRVAAYMNHIPCVYNAHGWAFSMDVSDAKKRAFALIERILAKSTDCIINISDSQQKLALKYNVAKENKMRVIYNGIDIKRFQDNVLRSNNFVSFGIKKDAFVVGMVCRLTEAKSPESFIKIAEKLLTKIENCYFILVGDGELREEIEQLIINKDLKDRVIITGWTTLVPMYVSLFNVGVLTSKWEGFGLSIVEYMAAGKPVVASNVGGISDIINNKINGILVPNNNIDVFVNGILKLKRDDSFREFIVNNAYETVSERFTIERVLRQHDDIYGEVLV